MEFSLNARTGSKQTCLSFLVKHLRLEITSVLSTHVYFLTNINVNTARSMIIYSETWHKLKTSMYVNRAVSSRVKLEINSSTGVNKEQRSIQFHLDKTQRIVILTNQSTPLNLCHSFGLTNTGRLINPSMRCLFSYEGEKSG